MHGQLSSFVAAIDLPAIYAALKLKRITLAPSSRAVHKSLSAITCLGTILILLLSSVCE